MFINQLFCKQFYDGEYVTFDGNGKATLIDHWYEK